MAQGSVPIRRIADRRVFAIGLGCMGLSVNSPPSPQEAVRIIHAALDAGVNLLDTAHCYVPSGDAQGHNEDLIREALATWSGDRDEILVATKGSVKRVSGTPDVTSFSDFESSGRADFIRENCETSLRALGVDTIDLYQLHGPQSDTPLTETMGVFRQLRDEGKVRLIGLSNVSVEQIEVARTVVDIASVQNRFNPNNRDTEVLDYCTQNSIAYLAYSPVGGLGIGAATLSESAPAFASIAAEREVSVHRVVLAWELSLSEQMIPIPGSTRPQTILDSAAAAELELSDEELRRLA